ncbi:hypothetical protein [Cellulomonas soli]
MTSSTPLEPTVRPAVAAHAAADAASAAVPPVPPQMSFRQAG